MSQATNEIAINVRDFIARNTGGGAMIAGGCARDVHFGVEPKDYDIVMSYRTSLSAIRSALELLGVAYREFSFYQSEELGGYSEDRPERLLKLSNDRIEKCYKFTYKGVDFDLLVYTVDHVIDALSHFDYNINQFVLMNKDKALFLGTMHPDDGLVAIRMDTTTRRDQYIKAKYAMLYGNLMDI